MTEVTDGSAPSDGTAPVADLRRGRRAAGAGPSVAGHQPAVDQALAVVHASIAAIAGRDTRPLLDAPPRPFRRRLLGNTALEFFPVAFSVGGFGPGVTDDECIRILDTYADAGGNAIDTGDALGRGRGELLVGDWLAAARGRRDRVIVMARVGRQPDSPGLSAASLRHTVDIALARLGTDVIDVLTLDPDDRNTPLVETLAAVDDLIRAGKVRYVAAGEFSADRLIEARIIAAQSGLPMFVAAQPRYSLLRRAEYEQRIGPVVLAQGLGALPRSPLGSGFLAGLASTRADMRRLRDLDPQRADRVAAAGARRGGRTLDALGRIAVSRNAATATVALAWLLTRSGVVAPISSASSVGQVTAIVAAAGMHLTRAEVTALERASAP